MEFIKVDKALLEGFDPPELDALIPSPAIYKALLIQPQGEIEADRDGVRHLNRALAEAQFDHFLSTAVKKKVDLAVSPEYSLPWNVLVRALKTGMTPVRGKLWALGCESIKYDELVKLRNELAPYAKVIFEVLDADEEKFLDPLAYVFTVVGGGAVGSTTVLLVQFKTKPMGDDYQFEVKGLQCGKKVYEFGGSGRPRILSLICSDAIGFPDDNAKRIYDRALIIHIQLNPKPRQTQFREYRTKLFGFEKEQATELICLNWARNVNVWFGGKKIAWRNISATAWYSKWWTLKGLEQFVNQNHRKGLYYTWLNPDHSHALFFNFDPALFLIVVTKIVQTGTQGSLIRRLGPQLEDRFVWDNDEALWKSQEDFADDGFAAQIRESCVEEAAQQIQGKDALEIERILALSAGEISSGKKSESWYTLSTLDSCVIDETEIILRLTFCQDTEKVASDFRMKRLKRFANLLNILSDPNNLPPALWDFRQTFSFNWSEKTPHQNVKSERGEATVIYLGEEVTERFVQNTAEWTEVLLGRGKDFEQNLTAQQRLVIWYRDLGKLKRYAIPHRGNYNSALASGIDFAKEG